MGFMTTYEFAPEQGQLGGQWMLYKLHTTQACNYPCKKLMCWGAQQISCKASEMTLIDWAVLILALKNHSQQDVMFAKCSFPVSCSQVIPSAWVLSREKAWIISQSKKALEVVSLFWVKVESPSETSQRDPFRWWKTTLKCVHTEIWTRRQPKELVMVLTVFQVVLPWSL